MLNPAETKIKAFFEQFPVVEAETGEVIRRAGQPSEFFFFVETGAIKMQVTSGRGQELVGHVFFPGSCFSLLDLIQPEPSANRYDFIALLPTRVFKAPKPEVMQFLASDTEVLLEFQRRLLLGLQGLLTRLEQHSFVPAYQQVAGLLLYFAKHFGEASPKDTNAITISLRLTHQEIANWLGLTRENVSVQMKQLEREGYISVEHSHLTILVLEKLKTLADLNGE